MPVHPASGPVAEDGTADSLRDCAIDRSGDGRRQRHEHDLVTLADDPHHAVTVLLAEIAHVEAGGLRDPQSQQSEQAYQLEVVAVRRVAAGGEHRLELKVAQTESRRGRGHARAADELRGRVFQHAVDDAGAVEPGHDR